MDASDWWVRRRGFLPDSGLADEALDEADSEPPLVRRRHRRVRPRPTKRRLAPRRVPTALGAIGSDERSGLTSVDGHARAAHPARPR